VLTFEEMLISTVSKKVNTDSAWLQVPGVPRQPWMDRKRGPHDLPVLWAGSRARQVWTSNPLQVVLGVLTPICHCTLRVVPSCQRCQHWHHTRPTSMHDHSKLTYR
jgi:hypothetical protein